MKVEGQITIPLMIGIVETQEEITLLLPPELSFLDDMECEIEFKNIIKEENK